MYRNDLRFFLYIVPMHGNLITIESGRLIAVSIPLSPLPGEINRKRTTSIGGCDRGRSNLTNGSRPKVQ